VYNNLTMSHIVPDLVDNQFTTQTTLGELLAMQLGQADAPCLWVATAYFNLDGLEKLGDALDKVQELRLLIGTEPDQEFLLTQRLWRELERNLALISPHAQQMLERWSAFLRQDTVQVRRYVPREHGRVLHGKAYLLLGVPQFGDLGVIGSSNFTGAGLTANLELNAILKQQSATDALKRWYEAVWEKSEDYKQKLLCLLTEFTDALKPCEVYFKVLYEAYRDRLSAKLSDKDGKPSPVALADFQRDGYHAAREILDTYQGVLIADSVGLGKTYLALRLLDDYAYQRRQTALVICPAALRDTVWKPLLEQHALPHRIESMEQVSQSDTPIDEYAQYPIIVVDESHNFRNPGSNRWRNLFEIVRRASERFPEDFRLILLTATPVNNSVYDLYHQVRLITRDDKGYFQAAGIENLEGYFRNAEVQRETLYELLEAIGVRRSRLFIRKHYPDAKVDGRQIHFPERRIHSMRYNLQSVYGGALYKQIANAIETLYLAPYQLDSYRREVAQQHTSLFGQDWEQLSNALRRMRLTDAQISELRKRLGEQSGLAGLMRVLYLKRLESSVEALRNSLRHQLEFQKRFLETLRQGKLLTSSDYRRMRMLEEEDEIAEGNWDEFLESLQPVDPQAYDMNLIEQAVQADVGTLTQLLGDLNRLTPADDDKLQTLLAWFRGEGAGKKVLLFSYYKDTARYVYEYLRQQLPQREIALITGGMPAEQRRDAVRRFAPRANRYTLQPHEREIEILVATDALSEGQNLQDASVIVNYDLHWNPVRMVQRIGRIDRIGSEHNTIEVYNFIPEDALEELLRLMKRLHEKLQAINRTVGLDASVLGEAPNPMDFNTLQRIAAEDAQVLDELEGASELNIGEFLLEDLLRFLRELGEDRLGRIPLGRGTAKRAATPDQRGFFAAFRNIQTEQQYWLFEKDDGTRTMRRLEAIRPIRTTCDEPPAPLPPAEQTEQKLTALRDYLVQQINRQVHRPQELLTVQKQIVLYLDAQPHASLRNELLGYFRQSLPKTDLRELGDLWRKIQAQEPRRVMEALKAFADAHPPIQTSAPRLEPTKPEDLECIAWMWVL
jgi:superfamily II DNA or RNA helicase